MGNGTAVSVCVADGSGVRVMVTVGATVGVRVRVFVGTGVLVGVAVSTGVMVTVGEGVAVCVGSGVSVGKGVPVRVSVGLGVAVSVAVGNGVAVTVGSGVYVPVGTGVYVSVGTGVDVSVGIGVGVSVSVGIGVAVSVGSGVDVSVGIGVGVSVGIVVAVSVGTGMDVSVGIGVSVLVGIGVCVGVEDAVALGVDDGVIVCVADGVDDGVCVLLGWLVLVTVGEGLAAVKSVADAAGSTMTPASALLSVAALSMITVSPCCRSDRSDSLLFSETSAVAGGINGTDALNGFVLAGSDVIVADGMGEAVGSSPATDSASCSTPVEEALCDVLTAASMVALPLFFPSMATDMPPSLACGVLSTIGTTGWLRMRWTPKMTPPMSTTNRMIIMSQARALGEPPGAPLLPYWLGGRDELISDTYSLDWLVNSSSISKPNFVHRLGSVF